MTLGNLGSLNKVDSSAPVRVQRERDRQDRRTLLGDVGPRGQPVLHVLLEELVEVALHLAPALGEWMQNLKYALSIQTRTA